MNQVLVTHRFCAFPFHGIIFVPTFNALLAKGCMEEASLLELLKDLVLRIYWT